MTATLMNCKIVSLENVLEVSSFIVNYFSNGAVYLNMLLTIALIIAINAGAPYFTTSSTVQVSSQVLQYNSVFFGSISVNKVV